MRFFLAILIVVSVTFQVFPQSGVTFEKPRKLMGPKLVVGIVIDQMRWDYLYRYSERYSAGGFKRILKEGFSCENTFISHTPTYTASGHAGIYTGSVPALHGIVGNNWYDRVLEKIVYCTDDSTVTTIGGSSIAGKMSPRNMLSTTVGDELRLFNNFRSKVIGLALKDRGSILPAGHSANAAYWFDNATGGWITSSYYMDKLPAWVTKFNDKKLPDQYLAGNWNTLYPIDTYTQSTVDNRPYEGNLPHEDNTFPHITANITNDKNQSFRYTPFANTFTFKMAEAAVEGERLGEGFFTDFLTVSCSSTDYIGHEFGPNSIEIEDTYLRLDQDLADFINFLDKRIGKGRYLLFLTADHAAAHVPAYVKEHHLPGGIMDNQHIKKLLNESVARQFKITDCVIQVMNYQVYLNHNKILASGSNEDVVMQYLISQLLAIDEISNAYRLDKIEISTLPDKLRNMITNGFNQKRSGDIQFIFKPGYFDGGIKGTTHGTWNPYDSHIPLLWYGWNVKSGKTNQEVYMVDIAPTVSAMLKIQMPSASIGNVIEQVLK